MDHPFHDPSVVRLIAAALAEDRVDDDVTSKALVPETARGVARLVARANGVLAGLPIFIRPSRLLDQFPSVTVEVRASDGDRVAPGQVLAELRGLGRELLGLERTLLNFLQRLSGIATKTAQYVAATSGTPARIQETRKTCPGFRLLDKYAVRKGGGLNHRMSLQDRVLMKENHLAFLEPYPKAPAAVIASVERARAAGPKDRILELEVESLAQLDAALTTDVDIVMLDDFDDAAVREAVARRNRRGTTPILEVSGGVRLERVRRLAEMGVDRISVGALTHSVEALDLALDLWPEPLP